MTDRVCVCNWKDCTSFLHSIQASSQCSDDDVWKGPPFRILTKPLTIKKLLLIQSLVHHVGKPEKLDYSKPNLGCTEIVMARHHWPRALLESNQVGKQITISVSASVMNGIAKIDSGGSKRLVEMCNTLQSIRKELQTSFSNGLVKDLLLKDDSIDNRHREYVKPPLESHFNVQSFVHDLTSSRSDRRQSHARYSVPVAITPRDATTTSATPAAKIDTSTTSIHGGQSSLFPSENTAVITPKDAVTTTIPAQEGASALNCPSTPEAAAQVSSGTSYSWKHDVGSPLRKNEIVQKVLHAKTGKAISTYKSENMGRGTKGETKSGIREMLKFTAGNNSIAKRKRNDAQEDYAKRKRKDEEED
jgi:hypothetical protein